MLEVVTMTRQSHSGEEDFLENEKRSIGKTDGKRSSKTGSDTECDDDWFDHIDEYDDIPMFRSED
ncbi:hypothetical protein AL013_11375 [Mariprofundus ferrooxydans]|uniref:Uncharacterized protein n=2 Tax=Mariprofundus ferrooxydans TaxID=314344 RepID=Q0F003_9PROT|nr:hypothetical protein SPV1_09308 [Mariprofundus ferrooxydans PV-1]KON46807.1 hypothetical protein AL013_11375 [Mariprofundus ferrooxydans]